MVTICSLKVARCTLSWRPKKQHHPNWTYLICLPLNAIFLVVCLINVSDICVYIDISYPVFLNSDEIKWYCLSHNCQRREAVECVVRCCQFMSVRRCCGCVIRFWSSTCLNYANTCPEISSFYILRRLTAERRHIHGNRNRLRNCVHHSTSHETNSRASSYIIQRVSCNPCLQNSKLICCFRHKSQGRHQICYSMCIFPNLLYIIICFIVLHAIFPMLWRHIKQYVCFSPGQSPLPPIWQCLSDYICTRNVFRVLFQF